MLKTLVLSVLVFATSSMPWSAGPYSLERCVETFNIAVLGKVVRIEKQDSKGEFVLSTVTLQLEKVYFGIDESETITFHYWSKTDNYLTIAHTISEGERVLLFLSTDLGDIEAQKMKPRCDYFLQFAKARNKGYLFRIQKLNKQDSIRDAIFENSEEQSMTLTKAEKIINASSKS